MAETTGERHSRNARAKRNETEGGAGSLFKLEVIKGLLPCKTDPWFLLWPTTAAGAQE